jgi:UDP-sugar transporter A1/2/3
MAIIGGTVSIYSAVLAHSSSTLTPTGTIYLLLLALNYSIMPRLSKKFIHSKTNKTSLALVEEMIKFSMGIGGFLITDSWSSIKGWKPYSTLIAAGLPSALYALQGTLTYTSYQNLDAFTFNGLTQLKTLSAALCCYFVMGKTQSLMQIIALAILSVVPLVLEDKFNVKRILSFQRNTKDDGDIKSLRNRILLGIFPCLGATLLSGLAGSMSQKSLQFSVGSMERNAYFYSAEISICTAFFLFISMMKSKNIVPMEVEFDGSNVQKAYFNYWNWKTFIPITVKASGGILTALVHKHSGSVMKGFSLVLGLVFSALLQNIIDGEDLKMRQIFGTALVLLSSWLHFTSPP